MQIVIDIPNWLYNAIMECKEPLYSKSLGDAVRDGTLLPKGATNGDMIKAMFPNVSNSNMDLVDVLKNAKSWWNAPYKAESEES